MKYLIILYTSIIFFSCNPNSMDDEQLSLPLITQSGENTFGCYIDGKLFVPRDGTGTTLGPDKAFKIIGGSNYSEFVVRNFKSLKGPKRMDFHFYQFHNYTTIEYSVKDSNCKIGLGANDTLNIRCRVYDEGQQTYKYYCSIADSGSLVFTRIEGNFIAGTFEFKAVNENDPNDIIEITQGRFDIDKSSLRYEQYP